MPATQSECCVDQIVEMLSAAYTPQGLHKSLVEIFNSLIETVQVILQRVEVIFNRVEVILNLFHDRQ